MDSKKIPTKKKQEIVEISKNLIDEKGVNNVSIRDIVKNVGMAQGLFYYYFKSKEEILEIIINEYVEAFCIELENSVDGIQMKYDNWKEKIETTIKMLVKLYKDNTSPLEKFNNKKNKDLYMSMVYATIDRLANLIEKVITEALSSGFIKLNHPKETAYVLIYGIIDLINHKKIVDEKIQEIDGDISKIINNLVQITFSGVLNITLGITNILINFILGLIISIYILLEKETLKYQLKLLINTVATDKYKSSIIEILKLIYSKFKKYIFGQAIDSAILFIMIFISMTIFKIPYAIFISFILAICAAVPILGPLIGIIITTIIMIIAGYKNILFFILIVVLMQQIEGNIIYPIVVGNSIGLSSLYIVVVVIVFSSLFGIFGVIIGVPLCGVLYEIICKYVYKKDFIEK